MLSSGWLVKWFWCHVDCPAFGLCSFWLLKLCVTSIYGPNCSWVPIFISVSYYPGLMSWFIDSFGPLWRYATCSVGRCAFGLIFISMMGMAPLTCLEYYLRIWILLWFTCSALLSTCLWVISIQEVFARCRCVLWGSFDRLYKGKLGLLVFSSLFFQFLTLIFKFKLNLKSSNQLNDS